MTKSIRGLSIIVVATALTLKAQWLNYPTAGVPRTARGAPNLMAPTPRAADGKPDLSGLWEAGTSGDASGPVAGGNLIPPEFINIAVSLKEGLPYQSWARDLWNVRQANNQKDNPDGKCLPLGIVQMHSSPLLRKILQVSGLVAILYEKNNEYRQIFTDGRPLPIDPQPSWKGYSSGIWEGDTLVVQTVGFRNDLWADTSGTPLTDSATVTERFRRRNFGNLEIEVTVNDPKAYTSPWTVKINHHLKLDTELLEFVCLENEKDQPHLVGK
jgi:hypothetical protein